MTRLLQPLDLTFFSSLKKKLSQLAHMWHAVPQNAGQTFSKYSVMRILYDATEECLAVPTLIPNGFRRAGLFPWNPNAPDKTKLEPGTIYSATPSQQPENETTIETTETRISSSPTLMMTKDSVSSPPSLLRTHNSSSFPNNVSMTEKYGGSFSVTEDIGSSVSELLVIENSISSSPTVLVTQDIGTFSPTLLMTEYNVSQFPTFPRTEVEGSDSSSPTLLDTEDGSRSNPSFLVTEDNI